MHPNELSNAMKVAESKGDALGLLSNRIHAILDIYRTSVASFLTGPRRFNDQFDLLNLATAPKAFRDEYFKSQFQALLDAAVQATLLGEEFHAKQHIKASEKLTATVKPGIPGVVLPDLDGPKMPNMADTCTCGHHYGQHMDGVSGPCTSMECDCKHFVIHEVVK